MKVLANIFGKAKITMFTVLLMWKYSCGGKFHNFSQFRVYCENFPHLKRCDGINFLISQFQSTCIILFNLIL